MANVSLSQLTSVQNNTDTDLLEISKEDQNSVSGYVSRKTTAANLADYANTTKTYSGLNTTHKTIVEAINDAAQSGGGGGGSGEADYSLNEISLGSHWIDGKPIYRKVFQMGQFNTSDNRLHVDISALNVDSIVKTYGVFLGQGYISENFDSSIPYLEPFNPTTSVSTFVYGGEFYISRGNNSTYNGAYILGILEYTKTTDTATINIQTPQRNAQLLKGGSLYKSLDDLDSEKENSKSNDNINKNEELQEEDK